MPKRMCPFQHDLLPQLKIHLSEKEVFTTSESRKKVHDKTVAMLFNGARSTPALPTPSCETTPIPQPSASVSDNKRFTQLYLNSKGRLVDHDTGKKMQEDSVGASCGSLSPVCQTKSMTSSVSCGNCDKRVCLDCIRACQQCGGDICVTCVQMIFSRTDRYVCRDCS